MPLAPGSRVGPYVVLAPIATGGMGIVYRARDTKLDRDVALKVLPQSLAGDAVALGRFESEAKAVAALSHPGILAIYDFGRIDDVTFAVGELLEGETLRAVLVRGALPVDRALDVAAQAAEALAAAHLHGFVHRDLKPENIFLTRIGRVKILDFGLAVRVVAAGDRDRESTLPTEPVLEASRHTPGTAAYMSPEHAQGLSVDAQSDQFSLGIVLYESLAGVRPFRGASSVEVLSAILRDEPRPLTELVPGLPEPVRWTVDRCLRKRPEERYASTLDLADDLKAYAVRLHDGTLSPARRRVAPAAVRWGAVAAAGLLLVLAAGAGRRFASGPPHEDGARLAGLRVRMVTGRAMNSETPTISPSGHSIAFVTRPNPFRKGICVQNASGGRTIDVTPDGPGEDGEPAFSPDESQLAFRSERDGGGLYVMDALGGDARRLTSFGHDPAWFPDGRRIVFATTASPGPSVRLGSRSELWTVDLSTGATSLLYAGDAVRPAVSPHGLRVAFWALRASGAQRDILTIPAKPRAGGPAPVLVTDDTAVDWSPFWMDDGRSLCFGSDRGGTLNLWRVRIDEATGTPLHEPEPFTLPARRAGPFAASADGRRIVYQAGTSEFDLERVPLDAGGLPSGPPVPLVSGRNEMGEPRLSPSGDLVTFSSRDAGEELWVVGTDGRGLRSVTSGRFHDRSPSFSADGKVLYFQSDRSGAIGIWKVGLDGSGLELVARREGLQPFRALVSRDGGRIALQVSTDGPVLLPIGLAPGSPWPDALPAPEEGVRFEVTSFSDDGRLVAGHGIARDETYSGLWLLDLSTRRYDRLAPAGACPKLVRGGTRVYFLRQRTLFGPATVAFLDVASRRTLEVPERNPDAAVVAFSAAPDGTALYLVRERKRSDIWLATLPWAGPAEGPTAAP